jgi:hypothetical protein
VAELRTTGYEERLKVLGFNIRRYNIEKVKEVKRADDRAMVTRIKYRRGWQK